MSSARRLLRVAPLAVLGFVCNVHAQQALSCATYSFSSPVSSAPSTSGGAVNALAGEIYTFTLTAGTATSASWRIVSDGSGSPASTLTGGGTLGSSLTYVVPVSGTIPIGYYVDAINGTGTMTGICSAAAPRSVPATTPMSLTLGAAVLALLAGVFLRRRA